MTIDIYLPRLAPEFAETLRSDNLKELSTSTADAFFGLPILSLLKQTNDTIVDFKRQLEFKKIVTFLSGLADTTKADRERFIHEMKLEEDPQQFVENIFLLLGRYDDMSKPKIASRIWAAHIRGEKVSYEVAMRLSAIIDRCYAADLKYITTLKPGLQGQGSDIAITLHAAGLLKEIGHDGGNVSDPESGGTLYDLNQYGKILLQYGTNSFAGFE